MKIEGSPRVQPQPQPKSAQPAPSPTNEEARERGAEKVSERAQGEEGKGNTLNVIA